VLERSTTFWKKGLALCSDPVARRGVGGAARKVRSAAAAESGGGSVWRQSLMAAAPAAVGGLLAVSGTAGTDAVPAPSPSLAGSCGGGALRARRAEARERGGEYT
jgi:hypothetical protein